MQEDWKHEAKIKDMEERESVLRLIKPWFLFLEGNAAM